MISYSILILLLTTVTFVTAQRDQETWGGDGELCCVCAPFYICGEDGKVDLFRHSDKIQKLLKDKGINEHNFKNFTVSKNVKDCGTPVDYCCLLPTAKQACNSFKPTIPKINKEPRPSVQCECMHWELCHLDSMVTDGKGVNSSKMEEYGLVTHSQCKEELQVCCSDVNPTVLPRSGPNNQNNQDNPECVCVPHEQCLPDGTFNTGGEGIIQPRLNNQTGAISPRLGNTNKCQEGETCCFPSNDQEPGTGMKTGTGTGTGTGSMESCNSIFIGWSLLVLGYVFKSS